MRRPIVRASAIGFVAGLALLSFMLAATPPEGVTPTAWRVAAVGALMVAWWVTEAVPIPVTALLPLACFPILGVADIGAAAAPYANPVIFLFLGGFVIAKALQHCGLHRRMALGIIAVVGDSPAMLVGGFMIATAFISMWVSNTATVVMMFPMATSVIDRFEQKHSDKPLVATFTVALLLGLAYSANIGGLGTLIGSPPNALLAGFASGSLQREIGFAQWMLLGVPLVLIALPLTWLLLVRRLRGLSGADGPANRSHLRQEWRALGPLSRTEWIVGVITLLVASSWLYRPLLDDFLPGLSDAGIAIAGAMLVFAAPVIFPSPEALTWSRPRVSHGPC